MVEWPLGPYEHLVLSKSKCMCAVLGKLLHWAKQSNSYFLCTDLCLTLPCLLAWLGKVRQSIEASPCLALVGKKILANLGEMAGQSELFTLYQTLTSPGNVAQCEAKLPNIPHVAFMFYFQKNSSIYLSFATTLILHPCPHLAPPICGKKSTLYPLIT